MSDEILDQDFIDQNQLTFVSSKSFPLSKCLASSSKSSFITTTTSFQIPKIPATSIVLQPPPPSPSTPPLTLYPRFNNSTTTISINTMGDETVYDTLPPPYRFDEQRFNILPDEPETDFIDGQILTNESQSEATIQIGSVQYHTHSELEHISLPSSPTQTQFSNNISQLQVLKHKALSYRRQSSPQIVTALTRSSSTDTTATVSTVGAFGMIAPLTMSANGGNKEKRIGHRRVNDDGIVTYKRIKSTQIMYSIQLGIGYSVGSLASKPERDLLMQDFMQIETVHFPKSGSQTTPAHHYTDFTFSTYTPIAFRYFRDLFRIQPDDFMLSIVNDPLQELSNPGASGSVFYLTNDDRFILKTVEHQEAKFLLKLLPGYYMNLSQNPHTLLPKFFGLYCYECSGKNIRILVMDNLLPSSIKIHQKYDLKGSTFRRKASSEELRKNLPTFKDLDFLDHYYNAGDDNSSMAKLHASSSGSSNINRLGNLKNADTGDDLELSNSVPAEGGLLLQASVYDELIGTLERDCRVLQSFEIMDYSLLVGVHNYDQSLLENQATNKPRFDYDDDEQLPTGAIRAVNRKGERLLLFVGIIDILQSYRLVKKFEHTWKSLLHDGDSISVHKPNFYAKRFLNFMAGKVFGRLVKPGQSTKPYESNYYKYSSAMRRKRYSNVQFN